MAEAATEPLTYRQQAWQRLRWVLALIGVLWIVLAIDQLLFRGNLAHYGIVPRSPGNLPAILWSPLLHGGVQHLAANTVPLLLLGGIVAIRGARQFLLVSLMIVVLGGLGVWAIGRTASHVGASGLIFGYFGYLLARGWFERSFSSILIAVVVAVIYGGMLWGIVPDGSETSWEAHLCGLGAGVLTGWWFRPRKPLPEEAYA